MTILTENISHSAALIADVPSLSLELVSGCSAIAGLIVPYQKIFHHHLHANHQPERQYTRLVANRLDGDLSPFILEDRI